MWLNLSDTLVFVGNGGINRFEELGQYDKSKEQGYNTVLFSGLTRITLIKETVQEIQKLLNKTS